MFSERQERSFPDLRSCVLSVVACPAVSGVEKEDEHLSTLNASRKSKPLHMSWMVKEKKKGWVGGREETDVAGHSGEAPVHHVIILRWHASLSLITFGIKMHLNHEHFESTFNV